MCEVDENDTMDLTDKSIRRDYVKDEERTGTSQDTSPAARATGNSNSCDRTVRKSTVMEMMYQSGESKESTLIGNKVGSAEGELFGEDLTLEEAITLTVESLEQMRQDSMFFQARDPQPIVLFDPSEIKLGPRLGQGEFGTVREVHRLAVQGTFGSVREVRQLKRRESLRKLHSFSFGKMFDSEYSSVHTSKRSASFDDIDGKKREIECSASDRQLLTKQEKRRLAMEHSQFKDGRARYAVKKPREDLSGRSRIDACIDLAREAMFLSHLIHPNIVRLRGATGIPGHPNFMIIMDRLYMTLEKKVEEWKNGNSHKQRRPSIFNYIIKNRNARFSERLMAAYDICRALAFLHHHNILYRDLKPQNVGFDVRGHVRLFDLGMAKELKAKDKVGDDQYHCTQGSGTRRWMAPEVVLGQPYGLKSDVYCFGLMLWHLFTLQIPYGSKIRKDTHMKCIVLGNKRPNIPRYASRTIKSIMKQCWDADFKVRPPLDKVARSLAQEIASFHNGDSSSIYSRSAILNVTSMQSLLNAFKNAGINPDGSSDNFDGPSSNISFKQSKECSGSNMQNADDDNNDDDVTTTRHSISSSEVMRVADWAVRSLLGSTIGCKLPSLLNETPFKPTLHADVYQNRGYSHNQEIWQDASCTINFKAEIQPLAKNIDVIDVMKFFFKELSYGGKRQKLKVKNNCDLPFQSLPEESSVLFAQSSFFAPHNGKCCNVKMFVSLCIIRLPKSETDLLFSTYSSMCSMTAKENTDMFLSIMESLQVDWNHVSWNKHQCFHL